MPGQGTPCVFPDSRVSAVRALLNLSKATRTSSAMRIGPYRQRIVPAGIRESPVAIKAHHEFGRAAAFTDTGPEDDRPLQAQFRSSVPDQIRFR